MTHKRILIDKTRVFALIAALAVIFCMLPAFPASAAGASISGAVSNSARTKNTKKISGKTYADIIVTAELTVSGDVSAAAAEALSDKNCYEVTALAGDSFEAPVDTVIPSVSFSGDTVTVEARFNDVLCYDSNGGTFEYAIDFYGDSGIGSYASQTLTSVIALSGGGSDAPEPQIPSMPYFVLKGDYCYDIKAGESKEIEIVLQNLNESNYVTSAVADLSDDNDLIDIENSIQTKNIEYQLRFKYKVTVSDKAEARKYPLTLNVSYTDKTGTRETKTFTIYIKVLTDEVDPINAKGVTITDYSFDKTGVKKGDKFNLSVTVANTSGAEVKDAVLELTSGIEGAPISLDSGFSFRNINLKDGAKTTVTFPLIATDDPSLTRAIIGMQLSYQFEDAEPVSKSTNAYLSCYVDPKKDKEKEEEEKKPVLQPNIIITGYDFGGDHVVGGKIFPLSISIKNASKISDIQNLKITIQGLGIGGNGAAYSPANSSNTFFIESLGTQQSTDVTLDLLPKADAVPDSYPVEVTFEFEYKSAGEMTKSSPVSEQITIPLQQEDRFSITASHIDSEGYVGSECYLEMKLVNKGKSPVYNVTVDIEGTGFTKSEAATFIGNIQAGSEEYYDARITPEVSGDMTGNVVVTYEDANGNEKTAKCEFIISVMEMMMWDEPMYDDPYIDADVDVEPEGGMPVWGWIAIAAGAVVVIIVVIVICVKSAKKRRLRRLEEEDEDI